MAEWLKGEKTVSKWYRLRRVSANSPLTKSRLHYTDKRRLVQVLDGGKLVLVKRGIDLSVAAAHAKEQGYGEAQPPDMTEDKYIAKHPELVPSRQNA